ncbi:MAG: aldehyde dehydrogenase family protein, partial [Bacteroidales bacterium]|nr:aldehyde dehydrogenase family protein [Bacteroidales bacterium]
MGNERISAILENQQRFFAEGRTLDVRYRLEVLKKLRLLILEHEPLIKKALWNDFHKPEFEVVATETRFVIKELNHAIGRLRRWAKPQRVRTPIVHFIATSRIVPQPYGQVLILSPWNYPFQLAMVPVIGALAAGNCVVMKVSQQVPHTTAVLKKIIENFSSELIVMLEGDHVVSEQLLDHNFDYIFFTGSCKIGKYVMEKAAVNLTPLSLELGGKNPCVVTADARLDFAARRIVWGKFMNAGQTCICPDYLLVDKKIKDRFLKLLGKEITASYGPDPEKSSDYARIISSNNVRRLESLMHSGTIVAGGRCDPEGCYVEPTVIKDITPGDPVMDEEVFGPLLPVIDYEDFNEVYGIIECHPKPLAVYIFTTDKKTAGKFIEKTKSGTAAINDTVVQIASP